MCRATTGKPRRGEVGKDRLSQSCYNLIRKWVPADELQFDLVYEEINPDSRLGDHVRQFMARDKTHLVAMTGSYFRGDAEAVLHPDDESRFDTVTYTYYEQLNGYQYLKQLDI